MTFTFVVEGPVYFNRGSALVPGWCRNSLVAEAGCLVWGLVVSLLRINQIKEWVLAKVTGYKTPHIILTTPHLHLYPID